MDTELEAKLENALKDWETARKKKDEFVGHRLTGEAFAGKNFFELGLAYADEQRALTNYKLAEAEMYPDAYSKEKVEFLKREIERLNKRVNAFKNYQLPTRE